MTTVTAPTLQGIDGFIADLEAEGCNPVRDGGVVIYDVAPATGAHAGTRIRAGVNVDELAQWPTVPPHWLHFENHVVFARTNPDTAGCLPGWTKHSRDIGPWDGTRPPVITWLAHVLGVAGEAV